MKKASSRKAVFILSIQKKEIDELKEVLWCYVCNVHTKRNWIKVMSRCRVKLYINASILNFSRIITCMRWDINFMKRSFI